MFTSSQRIYILVWYLCRTVNLKAHLETYLIKSGLLQKFSLILETFAKLTKNVKNVPPKEDTFIIKG